MVKQVADCRVGRMVMLQVDLTADNMVGQGADSWVEKEVPARAVLRAGEVVAGTVLKAAG